MKLTSTQVSAREGATRSAPLSWTPAAKYTGRTRFLLILALLVWASAFPVASYGVEASLTLVEAQRRAMERSRQTLAHDRAAAASRDMAVAAGRLPDPVLKFGVDNLPVSGADQFSTTADFMTMRRVGVMQEFTRAEKRQLRAQRFELEAEKFLTDKAATVAMIQRETALAWLDRHYAESLAAVIAEQTHEAKLEVIAAEGAYRAGRVSQADVIAAHGAVLGLEDDASEASRRIRTAKTALGRWAGDEAADLPLADKQAIDVLRLDTAALDAELAHHPEIAILTKQEQIAAAEARIAQADKKLDWSLEVVYAQRGPAYSNMVSVGVSIPLQWDQKNRQERELASRLAMVDQARAEREESLRMHRAEIGAMVAEWESGRDRVARYEREIIPLAKERTRAALAAFKGGKTPIAELLAGRRNEIEARIRALRIEMEVARLWAQLSFLRPDSSAFPHRQFSPRTDRQ
jgi:outer membrane protein TolC